MDRLLLGVNDLMERYDLGIFHYKILAIFDLQTLHKKMVLSNEKTLTNPPENVRQHVLPDVLRRIC